MADDQLTQHILDRQGAMEIKIDSLVEAVHEIALNERDQTVKIDGLQRQMDDLKTQVADVQKVCTAAKPMIDDAEEVSQGVQAGVRLAMRNPRYLWILIAALCAFGLIDSATIQRLRAAIAGIPIEAAP